MRLGASGVSWGPWAAPALLHLHTLVTSTSGASRGELQHALDAARCKASRAHRKRRPTTTRSNSMLPSLQTAISARSAQGVAGARSSLESAAPSPRLSAEAPGGVGAASKGSNEVVVAQVSGENSALDCAGQVREEQLPQQARLAPPPKRPRTADSSVTSPDRHTSTIAGELGVKGSTSDVQGTRQSAAPRSRRPRRQAASRASRIMRTALNIKVAEHATDGDEQGSASSRSISKSDTSAASQLPVTHTVQKAAPAPRQVPRGKLTDATSQAKSAPSKVNRLPTKVTCDRAVSPPAVPLMPPCQRLGKARAAALRAALTPPGVVKPKQHADDALVSGFLRTFFCSDSGEPTIRKKSPAADEKEAWSSVLRSALGRVAGAGAYATAQLQVVGSAEVERSQPLQSLSPPVFPAAGATHAAFSHTQRLEHIQRLRNQCRGVQVDAHDCTGELDASAVDDYFCVVCREELTGLHAQCVGCAAHHARDVKFCLHCAEHGRHLAGDGTGHTPITVKASSPTEQHCPHCASRLAAAVLPGFDARAAVAEWRTPPVALTCSLCGGDQALACVCHSLLGLRRRWVSQHSACVTFGALALLACTVPDLPPLTSRAYLLMPGSHFAASHWATPAACTFTTAALHMQGVCVEHEGAAAESVPAHVDLDWAVSVLLRHAAQAATHRAKHATELLAEAAPSGEYAANTPSARAGLWQALWAKWVHMERGTWQAWTVLAYVLGQMADQLPCHGVQGKASAGGARHGEL